MARRRLLRYARSEPLDAETEEKYLLSFNKKLLYHNPDLFPKLNAQTLFQCNRPFHLEIGCSCGDFLCTQARQNPDAVFVGIDILRKPLYSAVVQASEQALDNIRFIYVDFKLTHPLLSPETLDRVYLHFPDPHHRRVRFRKRRIFTPAFLNVMAVALKPNGHLSVMTDVIEYFVEMLTLIEMDTRFQKAHPNRYLVGFETEGKSRYQRVWEKHGLPTLRFEVKKTETK